MTAKLTLSFLSLTLLASTAWSLDWTVHQLTAGHALDGTADLTLAPDGQPAVVVGGSVLRYHRFDGTGWHEELIHDATCGQVDPVLIFDDAGEPIVAWHDQGDDVVRLARRGPAGWSSEVVADVVGRARPSLELDAAGQIAVGHATFEPQCIPRVSRETPGGWTTRVLDDDLEAQLVECWPSLTRTTAGTVAAAWAGRTVLLIEDVDTPEIEPVEIGGWSAQTTATRLTRDRHGTLHVTWQGWGHTGRWGRLFRQFSSNWVEEQDLPFGEGLPEVVFPSRGGVVVTGVLDREQGSRFFESPWGSYTFTDRRLVALASRPDIERHHAVYFDETTATLQVEQFLVSASLGIEVQRLDVLASSEDIGSGPTLAVTPDGRLGLASGGGGLVHLSRLEDDTWTTEPLPDTGDFLEGLTLVFDASSEPVLLHGARSETTPAYRDLVLRRIVDGEVRHHRWETFGRRVDLQWTGNRPGLTLDRSGRPVVSADATWRLGADGEWSDGAPYSQYDADLAIDEDGRVVACPLTRFGGGLQFDPQPTHEPPEISSGCRTALDDGRVLIAARRVPTGLDLIREGPEGWVSETVTERLDRDAAFRVTVDEHGRPLVAYRVDGLPQLARWTLDGWVSEPIDGPAGDELLDDGLALAVVGDQVAVALHARDEDCRQGPRVVMAELDDSELWSLHRWSLVEPRLLAPPTLPDQDETAAWPTALGPPGARVRDTLDATPLQLYTVRERGTPAAGVVLRLTKLGEDEIALGVEPLD
ncbi:MAG: hypothetical protein AAF533_02675 [Acidobacteriota bacterium]